MTMTIKIVAFITMIVMLVTMIMDNNESMIGTGVAQSVKAVVCRSEVVFGRGFDPRLG